MQISVVNRDPRITTAQLLEVVRAVNVQIERDFAPYWHMSARLRVDGLDPERSINALSGLRGDAILYIDYKPRAELAGYHEKHQSGTPFGFVFTALADDLQEPWSVAFSHEALELLADPECNLLCKGPHPDSKQHRRHVFHWYEVCDAVQSEHYEIDGVPVSNFVLPTYFTGGEELEGRNDFLDTRHDGKRLRSFSCNPGGYVGFYDPKTGRNRTYMNSDEAERRAAIKGAMPKHYRRANRRDQDHSVSTSGAKSGGAKSGGAKKKASKKRA